MERILWILIAPVLAVTGVVATATVSTPMGWLLLIVAILIMLIVASTAESNSR